MPNHLVNNAKLEGQQNLSISGLSDKKNNENEITTTKLICNQTLKKSQISSNET